MAPSTIVPDESWRHETPPYRATQTSWAPSVKSFTLRNKVLVYVIKRPRLPLVVTRIILSGGAKTNPAGAEGLEKFTAELTTRGAGGRTSEELAYIAEKMGATIEVESTYDTTTLQIDAEREHFAASVRLLADLVRHPTFPEDELVRLREETKLRLSRQAQTGTVAVHRVFQRLLYGPGHPYGVPADGAPENVEAFTRDLVLSHYRQSWRPERLSIVVVGDVDLDEASKVMAAEIGDWAPQAAPSTTAPISRPVSASAGVYLVDGPPGSSAAIVLGHLAPSRPTLDWITIELMNRVLGGMHASRISLNLREDKGYTYVVRSQFAPRVGDGMFAVRGEFRFQKCALAVREMIAEIRGMGTRAAEPNELRRASGSILLEAANQLQANAGTAQFLDAVPVFGEPMDFLDRQLRRAVLLKPEDLLQAAKRYLRPDDLIVVARGPRAELRRLFSDAGFGQIFDVDDRGNPIGAP